MPGWSEVADYVHVSTYQRWAEVARWYWGLVQASSCASTPDRARDGARRLTARGAHRRGEDPRHPELRGAQHPLRRPGVRHPRLQAVSRRPGAGAQVRRLQGQGLADGGAARRDRHRRRSWCCCARAAAGDLDDAPASLAAFDHAIAYVPKYDLYLDGTAEFSGSRELPWQDQGVLALHIDAAAASCAARPCSRTDSNLTRAPEPLGASSRPATVRVDEELELRGQAASLLALALPGRRPAPRGVREGLEQPLGRGQGAQGRDARPGRSRAAGARHGQPARAGTGPARPGGPALGTRRRRAGRRSWPASARWPRGVTR